MKRRFGFTRIDMLMIIMVFSILAVIVIPRVIGTLHRKTNEATLRGNLHQLRDAIQQFEADCGDYPAKLEDLMRSKSNPPDLGGNRQEIDRNYVGPYLKTADGGLPLDPFTQKADWVYNPKTGDLHSSSILTAMDGHTKYSEW